jgi:zinc and cadmium transporter
MLTTILISTVLLGAVSLVGLVFFYLREKTIENAMLTLTAFASGVLLATSFLYILPRALPPNTPSVGVTLSVTLVGLMIFFILERVFYWHHLHEGIREIYPFSYLNVLGDAIHNFVNGVAVAAAFLASFMVGAMTTFALFVHAIPQELSDFALLLHGGMKKGKALACSLASGAAVVVGGLVVYFFFDPLTIVPYALAFAGGAFVYMAAVDLVLRLHPEDIRKRSVIQLAFFLVGAVLVQTISMLV